MACENHETHQNLSGNVPKKTLSTNATASVYASIGDVRRSRGLGALMAPELEKLSPLDQMVGGSDPAA